MRPCSRLQLSGGLLYVTGAAAAVQVGNVAPLNVTQFFDGLVTIVDPAAFSDTSAKIRASVVGGVIAATGAPPVVAPAFLHADACMLAQAGRNWGLKLGSTGTSGASCQRHPTCRLPVTVNVLLDQELHRCPCLDVLSYVVVHQC